MPSKSAEERPRHELVVLEPPGRAALDAERDRLLAEAHLPDTIDSRAAYEDVAALELRVGQFIARVEPLFDDHCAAAHKVWKSACTIRALFLDGPKALKAKARALLAVYVATEARARQDRERALAETARQDELARLAREAASLEAAGQPEIAAAVRATPVDLPAIVLPTEVPDVGLTYRDDWYWQPVGGDTPANRARALAMLVRADYVQLLRFDDGALTAFAKRTKGTIRIPGIEFKTRKVPVRR